MSKVRALEIENERLRINIVNLESEVNRLSAALDATIAEKERCRKLAVDWSLKADSYQIALERCENMKLAREFEELLQTTSIPVAVEKVRKLMAVQDAAKEHLEADGSITAQKLFDAIVAQAKEVFK